LVINDYPNTDLCDRINVDKINDSIKSLSV